MKDLNRIINKYIVLIHCLKFFQIISGLCQKPKRKRFAQKFALKAKSCMFDRVLNTPLKLDLSHILKFCWSVANKNDILVGWLR